MSFLESIKLVRKASSSFSSLIYAFIVPFLLNVPPNAPETTIAPFDRSTAP